MGIFSFLGATLLTHPWLLPFFRTVSLHDVSPLQGNIMNSRTFRAYLRSSAVGKFTTTK